MEHTLGSLKFPFTRLPVGSLEVDGVAEIHFGNHVNESGCWTFWRVAGYAVSLSTDIKGETWEPDRHGVIAALYSHRKKEVEAAIKAAQTDEALSG